MRKRYNEFVEKFYELLSNDRLVLTFICLLGAAICITVALLEILTGNNMETVFVYFVLIVYLLLMIFLCYKFPAKYDLFAALIMVPVNCAVFPYIFLISDGGGISSGMPIWLTFGLILIYIITNGVYTYVLIAVTVVIDLILFQFAYLDHPITDLPLDKAYYYRDNIVAIFGVSLVTGILLKYQKGIQKRQTERIQKAMQEAEADTEDSLTEYVRLRFGDKEFSDWKELEKAKAHLVRRGFGIYDINKCFDNLGIKVKRSDTY